MMQDGEVVHGTPVLVRNGSNDKWVLRTADRVDGSWVNEKRLATSEGESWRQWMPYLGGESFEGTSLPLDGKWNRGDICAYETEGRIRIGFLFGFGSAQKNADGGKADTAFVSSIPVAWTDFWDDSSGGQDLEDVPISSLKRPEELWPWWKPSLYAEQPDPNPFGARVVPV